MALNVLLVDDSATMRSMISRVLQMTGLPLGEIHQAANGREGLDMLGKHWIDIVLLDINMPVMSGLEMLDEMRRNPNHADMPVIVVSTEGSEKRIDELREQGVKFIRKPFTPESLRDVVNSIVGVHNEESNENEWRD
ncbi:MAG: response regulator [Planctomycetota bacterium]|nr:MAG: response regulator [Planctomycetota bacterium]